MDDTDAGKMRAAIEWATAEGKQDKITPEALQIAQSAGTSDADIDKLIAEMTAARKAKNFAKSDAIRQQLNDAGILVEITKDGVRWRRK
jgi:cysteinyl-tRNA synthetase